MTAAHSRACESEAGTTKRSGWIIESFSSSRSAGLPRTATECLSCDVRVQRITKQLEHLLVCEPWRLRHDQLAVDCLVARPMRRRRFHERADVVRRPALPIGSMREGHCHRMLGTPRRWQERGRVTPHTAEIAVAGVAKEPDRAHRDQRVFQKR